MTTVVVGAGVIGTTLADAPPNYRRSKVTVRRAKEALPNLQCENFTE
jgi:D-amino-acid dehydrogenase